MNNNTPLGYIQISSQRPEDSDVAIEILNKLKVNYIQEKTFGGFHFFVKTDSELLATSIDYYIGDYIQLQKLEQKILELITDMNKFN